MQIEGDYTRDGYALIRGLITREVARALMQRIHQDFAALPWRERKPSPILNREALEFYGNDYPPLQTFLWALTGAMEEVTGRSLVPTYDYFRIYREGDICRVHRDRPACEHSLSLTLDYSDDVCWPLEIGREGANGPADLIADDFGPEPSSSLAMEVGDAVAYRGTTHRHGRVSANPNYWSAHLFLHWVDRDGPHQAEAFDRKGMPQPVNLNFGASGA